MQDAKVKRNLIEIDEEEKGTIKIYRMYSKGGEELVLEKRRDKAMRWAL